MSVTEQARGPLQGNITFVGKGNPDPANFVIIPKDIAISNDMAAFVDQFMLKQFKLPSPKVLLSVTGGAQDFKMLSSKLEQVFNRGIVKAAENTAAWIITGGMDTGVMQFVGDAIKDQDFEEVPCIGIATLKKVSHNETLEAGGRVYYTQQKPNDGDSSALNPNHTHFILVDGQKWGDEIQVRNALEDHISRVLEVPLVLIVVNGGPGTISTVAEGLASDFPVILVEGSGRAADAIASMVKLYKGNQKGSEGAWKQLTEKMNQADVEKWKKTIVEKKNSITIFNPNEDATADMDFAILSAIINSSRKGDTFRNKLYLGVQWGRADVIKELLERDDERDSTQTKREALNHALQMALELDKPELLSLLVEKGADKTAIDLKRLYRLESVKYLVGRLLSFSGAVNTRLADSEMATISDFRDEVSQEKDQLIKKSSSQRNSLAHPSTMQLESIKKVLKSIDDMYYHLLVDGKTTFTDMLVWAIMVNRHELAKEVWKRGVLPIHLGLIAAHLYRTLASWFQGEEEYLEHATWFETQAIKVLDGLGYDVAKKALNYQWRELENKNAMQIAEVAECKHFLSHQYVQRLLDELLYTDDHGSLLVGTSTFTILRMLAVPFWGPYEPEPDKGTKFWHVYDLPIMKFWSSTITYLAFLVLLGYVVIYSGTMEFSPAEFVLWAWILANFIEEFSQFLEDKESYFVHLTNQMDTLMLFLLIGHVIIRNIAYGLDDDETLRASSDLLIIATIGCYIRLLNVFAFSQSLGPLFFVVIRLINDVAKWLFIFIIFLISFQLGVMALTTQAGEDMWLPYPDGGTFAVSFFTIIGDYSGAMPTMAKTSIGVAVLAVYALVAQIMLVNLLIAMMGDTYSDVKDNSDLEWKFYRFALVNDTRTSSPYPPPFNLFYFPFGVYESIRRRFNPESYKVETTTVSVGTPYQLASSSSSASVSPHLPQQDPVWNPDEPIIKKMKVSKERVIEEDEEKELCTMESLSAAIRENLRLMSNQRDSDRLFVEQNIGALMTMVEKLNAKIDGMVASRA